MNLSRLVRRRRTVVLVAAIAAVLAGAQSLRTMSRPNDPVTSTRADDAAAIPARATAGDSDLAIRTSITWTAAGTPTGLPLSDSSPLVITTASLPDGYEDVEYSVSLQATGGTPPYSWSHVGSLPAGLTLDTFTGALGGIPTSPEVAAFTVRVADSGTRRAAEELSLAIVRTEAATGELFVPDSFVPLSPFVHAEPGAEPYAVLLSVRPDILTYLSGIGATVQVARSTGGPVTYAPASFVSVSQGLVVHRTTQVEDCAAVAVTPTGAFENDYPIATHWNAQLNGGRGGFELGASDDVPGILAPDPDPHTYISSHAIFSDDPFRDPPVLGHGTGIAENFALSPISELWAVSDSNTVLMATGFPVVHRSHPWALNPSEPLERRVQEGVPAFQVVHAHLVEAQPGHGSLASFLLPPDWTASPTTAYPLLFNAFYDIHRSSYWHYGADFMTLAGNLINTGDGPVMGALWNAGYTTEANHHVSFYSNADLLFTTAASLGADPHAIVMTGGSKGGSMILKAASNPHPHDYSAKLVVAYGPATQNGTHAFDYSVTTYNGVMAAMTDTAGYKHSWMLGWSDPVSGLPWREASLQTIMGTTDPQIADTRSLWGDDQVAALASSGAKVVVALGTHDHFIPSNLKIRYTDKLRAAGVPVQSRLYYRFGHSDLQHDRDTLLVAALRELLAGNPVSMPEGTFHYRRASEIDYETPVPFSPAAQPIVFEAPILVSWGQDMSLVFLGGPEDVIELIVHKIDDVEWQTSQAVVRQYEEPFFARSFVLPPGNPIQSADERFALPTDGSLPAGYYVYEVFFTRPGGTRTQLPEDSVPHPSASGPPVFEVQDHEYPFPGYALYGLSEEGRTWGMSSEILD